MFSFFSKLLFRRPKEAFRYIFSYWDGYKIQHADPLDIQTKLDLDPEYRPDLHPLQAMADGPEGAKAYEICIRAFQRAYNLRPYDPTTRKGLTTTEVLQLHETFCLFCDSQKKSTSLMQTPQPSGVPTSTELEEPTTSDTSATNSISHDKSPEESIKPELASTTQL